MARLYDLGVPSEEAWTGESPPSTHQGYEAKEHLTWLLLRVIRVAVTLRVSDCNSLRGFPELSPRAAPEKCQHRVLALRRCFAGRGRSLAIIKGFALIDVARAFLIGSVHSSRHVYTSRRTDPSYATPPHRRRSRARKPCEAHAG